MPDSEPAETHARSDRFAPTLSRGLRREFFVLSAWGAADALVLIFATYVAAWLRYDFTVSDISLRNVTVFACLAALVFVVVGVAAGPYRINHTRGSFEETVDLARTGILAIIVLGVGVWVFQILAVPRSLPLTAPVIGVVLMCAVRFIVRSYRAGRAVSQLDDVPVIVYGAGHRGAGLIRGLLRDSSQTPHFVPVAAIDDDPRKRRLKLDGVRVRGTGARLADVAWEAGATKVVVAIPQATAEQMQRINSLAESAGLEVLVLPRIADMLTGERRSTDLRKLQVEDLLGREPITLDAAAISEAISGKRVLVTGAGGSIGSELCRQISKFGPAKLIMLDRDESGLHGTQMSLTGRALLDDGTLALTDIRDLEGLNAVFEREQPDVVFHAAALKHLTLLQQFPLEAWKTNVLGSLNVLEAARRVGVKTFVNISTDKAANPSCVLGYSKRCAERLTAAYASYDSGTYVSVRFGNVLGSRGSVVAAFTAQIERGGPVTVTHPDVERYFMLIPEACQLVLQAGAIGKDGEVMVLEMGSPMKIDDLAKTLINLSGKPDIDIVYTGLRQGEKMTEELFSPTEKSEESTHPLVRHVEVPPLAPASVHALDSDDVSTLEWMLDASSGHANSDECYPTTFSREHVR